MTDGAISAVISAGAGILGTGVGGLIAYFTQRAFRNDDRSQDIAATARGIGAELKAYVDLVSMRDHDKLVEATIKLLQSGQDVPISALAASSGTAREFFPLFYSNLPKLGALEGEIEELAKFHTQLAGIYSTLARAEGGVFDRSAIPAKISLLKEELALWQNTLKLGRQVSARLLNRY